uniref:Auxin-induced protein 6B n=1 Tax=Anthurium amnicola TaxID=1678845 RepID=A0A1D1YH57_9ARAE
MNPGVIWELVRSSHLIPAMKKGGRRKGDAGDKEGSRAFLLGNGDGEVSGLPPRGFVAVYVGPEMRRFVIPAAYLCLPAFRGLMEKVAEEFGFRHEGALQIPCDEAAFEDALRSAAGLHEAAAAAVVPGKGARKSKKAASSR